MTGAKLLKEKTVEAWGILHHSTSELDGERVWLEGCLDEQTRTRLFSTRKAAASHVKDKHGYIAKRRDLKAMGFRVPKPVRVTITVALAKRSEGNPK